VLIFEALQPARGYVVLGPRGGLVPLWFSCKPFSHFVVPVRIQSGEYSEFRVTRRRDQLPLIEEELLLMILLALRAGFDAESAPAALNVDSWETPGRKGTFLRIKSFLVRTKRQVGVRSRSSHLHAIVSIRAAALNSFVEKPD
jgi:hypothetical protein